MQARYNNSKPKFLDELVSHQKLTPDGRDWLTLALDPFHDLNHQAAGFPDSDGSQTIVSCYQYQTDISAPGGCAGNWDAHIFTTPMCSTQLCNMAEEHDTWTSFLRTTATDKYVGPLTIMTGPAGNALSPSTNLASNTCLALPFFGNTDLINGVSRVIGVGYEVTNTTAEMYKQGSVTSYRMPQYTGPVGSELVGNFGGTQTGVVSTQRWRSQLGLASQANLLKGTRTWDASAGVYATAVLNSIANPLNTASTTMLVLSDQAFTGNTSPIVTTGYRTVAANVSPVPSLIVPYATKTMPYDSTGSFFNGLSNATTLTVKVKFYVERAPLFGQPDLAVLATPSAGYDVTALELYSHAISHLPVAVTVAENGLGDWFRGVVRVLKDVAGGATAILGPVVPGAQQMGSVAQTILGRMDAFMNQKKPQSISNSVARVKKSVKVKKQPKASGPRPKTRK